MKREIVLNFVFIILMGQTVYAQSSMMQELIRENPPYPYVLSQLIDNLPIGFVTIRVGQDFFYYDKGVFFQKVVLEQKYVVVPPPIGAVVFALPQGYQLMLIDGISYYQYEGTFYKQVLEGYKVIFPPI